MKREEEWEVVEEEEEEGESQVLSILCMCFTGADCFSL